MHAPASTRMASHHRPRLCACIRRAKARAACAGGGLRKGSSRSISEIASLTSEIASLISEIASLISEIASPQARLELLRRWLNGAREQVALGTLHALGGGAHTPITVRRAQLLLEGLALLTERTCDYVRVDVDACMYIQSLIQC